MTELIIKAFVFLAIAISMPFAAGLAFACAAFSVIAAVSARRAGNKPGKDKPEVGFIPELPIVKDDITDCEDSEVAACGVRSPREVPPLYEYDVRETNEYAKSQLSDVMRLIGKTEDEARLNAVKRAIIRAREKK